MDQVFSAVQQYAEYGANGAKTFFIRGPAGTGKTFAYNVLRQKCLQQSHGVVMMAFTGNAATLLPGGQTCHSALVLPVPLTHDSISGIQPHYQQWTKFKDCKLVVIDEVAMAPSLIFKLLDEVLRRIKNVPDVPFAGVPVLFGGDLRQLGPIPDVGQVMNEIHFRNSEAYHGCRILELTQNMRTGPGEFYPHYFSTFAKFHPH